MTAFPESDIAYTADTVADWAVHWLQIYETAAFNRRALAEQDFMLRACQDNLASTVGRLIDRLIQLGASETAERLADWLHHVYPQEVPR